MPALFPYLPASTALHESFLMPWLPIDLWLRDCGSLSTQGLLDSGSTVNVMPYDLGIRLGAVWEAQTTRVVLTGNLAAEDARALLIHARVGDFPAVRLVFAWTHSENIPLLSASMAPGFNS